MNGKIGECPVKHGKADDCPAINPSNLIPTNLDEVPLPAEAQTLPTHRVTSSIPRAEGDSWVYPSERQFYAALHRKGNAPETDAIPAVLAIHNHLNEKVWNEILQRWEQLHKEECAVPKLRRFAGKPNNLTPRAWWTWCRSGVKPFDRHDWIIDRCGKDVRYVIDYYAVDDEKSNIRIGEDAAVFLVDTRPALDSLSALLDRMKIWWRERRQGRYQDE